MSDEQQQGETTITVNSLAAQLLADLYKTMQDLTQPIALAELEDLQSYQTFKAAIAPHQGVIEQANAAGVEGNIIDNYESVYIQLVQIMVEEPQNFTASKDVVDSFYTNLPAVIDTTIKARQERIAELEVTISNMHYARIELAAGTNAAIKQLHQDIDVQRQAYLRESTQGLYQEAIKGLERNIIHEQERLEDMDPLSWSKRTHDAFLASNLYADPEEAFKILQEKIRAARKGDCPDGAFLAVQAVAKEIQEDPSILGAYKIEKQGVEFIPVLGDQWAAERVANDAPHKTGFIHNAVQDYALIAGQREAIAYAETKLETMKNMGAESFGRAILKEDYPQTSPNTVASAPTAKTATAANKFTR
ncbi:MAG: hypothetical protein ACOYK8_01610 [Alphaproteobacteria bacterium]